MLLLDNLLDKLCLFNLKRQIASLNDNEKIIFIQELLAHYYKFGDTLTKNFYESILQKLEQNDISFLKSCVKHYN